jgi:integrase/recombinase XerD
MKKKMSKGKGKNQSKRASRSGKTPDHIVHTGTDTQQVTFAQAMSMLFGQDLHPTTGTSHHTVDSYKTTFRLLMRFLEQHRPELLKPDTPIEHFSPSLVEAFLRYLSTDRDSSPATINVRRAAFGALAKAVQRRHPHLVDYCHSIMAIPGRKTKESLIGYFNLNELQAIFDSVESSTPDGFRNLVLLRCLYNTGARASELCGLKFQDVRLEEPAHLVLRGKGGKVRTVPLWPVTADLLRAYLKAARRKPKAGYEDFVFIGRRGNVLTRHGLYKIARHHIQTAARNIPQLSRKELHPVCSFRHTTATHLLMAGVGLPVIQEILGHARLETTKRYRTVTLERKCIALQRMLELRSQKPSHVKLKTTPVWVDSTEAIEWLERL